MNFRGYSESFFRWLHFQDCRSHPRLPFSLW